MHARYWRLHALVQLGASAASCAIASMLAAGPLPVKMAGDRWGHAGGLDTGSPTPLEPLGAVTAHHNRGFAHIRTRLRTHWNRKAITVDKHSMSLTVLVVPLSFWGVRLKQLSRAPTKRSMGTTGCP